MYDYFNNVQFSQPYFFGLFLLLPLLIVWYLKRNNKNTASISISTTGAQGLGSWKTAFRHLPFILRLFAFAGLIFALANPQVRDEKQTVEGEGIDIMLCMDVSGSMLAEDFKPNRLEAAKQVAIEFINKRPTDRIGVVIFSGESFTQCPLTTDNTILISAVRSIRSGLLEDGTAIGSGLSTSVDRVRNGKAKSKIVVLLTDGVNNGGLIDPNTAKEIAKTFGIKVYTIGVGTDGTAPMPVLGPGNTVIMQDQKVTIDEKLLTEIATETGGKYFRAKDNSSLTEIYKTIDGLERSKVEITKNVRYQDKYFPFVLVAIFFLLLEFLFRYLLLRKFP